MQFKIIGALVFVIILGLLIWRVQYLQNENTRLETEVAKGNNTITVLDETADKRNELQQGKTNALDAIESTPETDDGDIAPILYDTINRL